MPRADAYCTAFSFRRLCSLLAILLLTILKFRDTLKLSRPCSSWLLLCIADHSRIVWFWLSSSNQFASNTRIFFITRTFRKQKYPEFTIIFFYWWNSWSVNNFYFEFSPGIIGTAVHSGGARELDRHRDSVFDQKWILCFFDSSSLHFTLLDWNIVR